MSDVRRCVLNQIELYKSTYSIVDIHISKDSGTSDRDFTTIVPQKSAKMDRIKRQIRLIHIIFSTNLVGIVPMNNNIIIELHINDSAATHRVENIAFVPCIRRK